MDEAKRATITDVAAEAKTSVATVSRVLSNADYPVSDALRARVEQAAAKLSFAYTTTQRQGRATGKDIGLVVPTMTNPFYMQTIQGISAVCFEKGYQLILCNSHRDRQRETAYLKELQARRVGGVIISSIDETRGALAEYISRGMLFVQLDQRFDNDGSFGINYDSEQGARLAVRHLVENGHRRIAFVSTPLTRWTRKKVHDGYMDQMQRAGLSTEGLTFILDNDEQGEWDSYEVNVGQQAANLFVNADHGATAAFCVNDMVAFGLMRGLHMLGLEVPGDISVVGFDDVLFASTFIPPLTTVHCAAYESGRLAAMMLIDRLETGGDSSVLNMHLQPRLIQRSTVRNILTE